MPNVKAIWGMDVESIVVDGARSEILFYGSNGHGIDGYRVVAGHEQKDAQEIKVGESIQYAPSQGSDTRGRFVGRWPFSQT